MVSLSWFTLIVIGLPVFVHSVKRLQAWHRRRTFEAANGCHAMPHFSRFQNLIEQIKAIKSHTYLEMWEGRYANIGKTFSSATMSINQIIFTIEPENIKTMLASDFESFELGQRRRTLMGPVTGPGIFSNDGAAWKHSRALLRPNFTKMIVSDLSNLESHVQDLLKVLPAPDLRSGLVEVDLMPLFFRMTLDTASETLLGAEMAFHSQLDAPGSESMRFMDAFDFVQNKIHRRNILDRGWGRPFGLAYLLYKGTRKDKFDEACETVQSVMDAKLLDYLRRPVKRIEDGKTYVFLDEMVRATRDPLELRNEILNVLMAGRDTTASLLTNTFFVLARRPDLWSRVRAEVESTFAGRIPDYEKLRDMRQLRNLLNECLRLYPPVPFNARTATKDTVLPRGGGPNGQLPIMVEKGQQVDYHVYCLHRSTEIYGPDAESFRPERWDDPSLRPGWGYIPFNGGPRICLGQQYALTEASYALVRLMQEFSDIENRDPKPAWKEQISLVTKSRNGAKVALRRVEKNS